jgi:hypothetical protein
MINMYVLTKTRINSIVIIIIRDVNKDMYWKLIEPEIISA